MRTITRIAVAIVLFALGWIVGLFAENWSWFKFSNEVSLLDVISLVITTAIGLYVAVVIQNNLESKRVEKEIIYGQLNFVEHYLSELRSEVSKEQAEGTVDIVAKIGGCRKFWSKIVTLIKEKYGIKKAPDRIYVLLDKTSGFLSHTFTNIPYNYGDSKQDIEYIRKDYLLEWAKDELKLSKDVECVSEKSYEEGRQQVALNLIDKLNEI